MKTSYKHLLKVLSLSVLFALLSACSEQVQEKNISLKAPIVYAGPPTIGNDTAIFNGIRSNYDVTTNAQGYTVKDKAGSDGTINLPLTTKSLVFKDISINLTIPAQSKEISSQDVNSIIELYIAYFNRVPDANGLSYWITQFKSGQSLDKIGESFYAAAILYSSDTGYSANMSNTEFVTLIYKNVLGRTSPDQEGLTHWINSLNNKTTTRGTLIRTMLNAAHTYKGDITYGWVAQLLDNKVEVAQEFSINQGITYLSVAESISKGMSIASVVTPTDTSLAKGIIQSLVGVKEVSLNLPSPTQSSRFLSQSTFGVTNNDINLLSSIGYSNWIDNQFTKSQSLHRTYMDNAAAGLTNGLKGLNQNYFFESFWQQVANGDDQLRQRVTFALSEIMVISFQDSSVNNYPRGVASYYDTLASNAFGNFRTLLEAVSLHPMMGTYLTSIRNQKATGTSVPDENYAREVMQLFTIGLYQLNTDGSPVLVNGKPVETYSYADITGLAKVFTGFSWAGPDKSNTRFFGGTPDVNRDWLPMQGYPNYHSSVEKTFLGTTIPVQSVANPDASLKVALDTLFNHQNVGPFFSKLLIQRLITSNPSPQYISRVASIFNNNGSGVRGDMKAVVKAILMDSEARNDPNLNTVSVGKIREPVLRLSQWIRSMNAKSATSRFRIGNLDDPLTGLAQTPMRSPTVFNFFRPGYVPPNSDIANNSLVSPELQITAETSVVGYLNYLKDIIQNGTGTARDVKADYSALESLAPTPEALVDQVNLLLMSNQMSTTLRNQIISSVNSVSIPTNNAANAATAIKNRVYLSVYLTMASPEYLVQK
jgi:uncharacterized protein (DUF1800 family)